MNEVIFVTKMVDKKNTMAINKAKTTHFCDVYHTLLPCVCFWIVTNFTKNFYAEFSGCDRRQILPGDSTPGCHEVTHKAKK